MKKLKHPRKPASVRQCSDAQRAALEEAIESAGGMTMFCEDIGATVSAVKSWRLRKVPAEFAPSIEGLTGVRVERLLPGVQWHHIRAKTALQSAEVVRLTALINELLDGARDFVAYEDALGRDDHVEGMLLYAAASEKLRAAVAKATPPDLARWLVELARRCTPPELSRIS